MRSGTQTSLDNGRMLQVAVPLLTDTCGDFTQRKKFQVENKAHVAINIIYGNACGAVLSLMVDHVFLSKQVRIL